jgi:hypothetical protein
MTTILRAVSPNDGGPLLTGRDVVRHLVEVLERDTPRVPVSDPTASHLRDLHALLSASLPSRR